ncbi:MAG: GAF domain-containing protein [Candidatus Anammoxibacter sp.]
MKHKFSNNTYKEMLEMSIELSRLHDMREVISLIMDKAVELLNADRSTLYLYNENENELISEFIIGERIKQIKLPLNTSSISGYSGMHKKMINIKNVYNQRELKEKKVTFNTHFDKINRYKTKSILSVPLEDLDRNLLGVLELINKKSGKGFSETDEHLLELFARQCSITVARLKMQQLVTMFPEYEQNRLRGRKDVFVVFFDITNYTRLSEKLGDISIKNIIKIWEDDHIRLIHEYGGTYVKSAGDSIMSIFGLNAFLPPREKSFKQKKKVPNKRQSKFNDFKKNKRLFTNLENLKELILDLHSRAINNRFEFGTALDKDVRRFLVQTQAENVVRFMFLAQKKLDWLDKSFIEKNLINVSGDRILMKGGAEFGHAIVDFDMYGRIDVIGDTVNTTARITTEGGRLTASTATDEHPIIVGKHLSKFLTDDFIYKTEDVTKLKGKEGMQYIYILDGIVSFDNRATIPDESYSKNKKYVRKQMKIMDNIKQGALPFNFTNYNIEHRDKYKTNHSERVAVIALFIVDLANRDLHNKINFERERIHFYTGMIDIIGKRLSAIALYLSNPGADHAKEIFQKPVKKLNATEKLILAFSVKELENWQKQNKHELTTNPNLQELYLHETNMFKSLRSPKMTQKQILKKLIHNKRDDLINYRNNLSLKQDLIKQYEALLIPDKKRNNVARAALLHDLGSQCLSEKVKDYADPSKCVNSISQEEREMYANVTASFGAYILSGIKQLQDLALIVKSCDLNFNGYYKGHIPGVVLKGEDIPIESRVISLANSIDSILSDQPFRPGHGKTVLCRILLVDFKVNLDDKKTKKFDPYLLSLILDFYRYEFPKSSKPIK